MSRNSSTLVPNAHLLGRIKLIDGDILQQKVDAIVTTVPNTLEIRGKLNTEMMEMAGSRLDEYMLENVYKPRIGEVFIAPGFNLAAGYVIFVVVPNWRTEFDKTDRDLLGVYRRSMETVVSEGFANVAFPALVTGRKSFPLQRASRLALQGIMEKIDSNVQEVRIVCYNKEAGEYYSQRLERLRGAE